MQLGHLPARVDLSLFGSAWQAARLAGGVLASEDCEFDSRRDDCCSRRARAKEPGTHKVAAADSAHAEQSAADAPGGGGASNGDGDGGDDDGGSGDDGGGKGGDGSRSGQGGDGAKSSMKA